jgi:hypothetical protein
MLSHQDKCVFVHIPKAAGQSVESVFVTRAGLTWETRETLLLRPNEDPSIGPPRLAHLMAREYVELGHMTAEQYQQYFTFSFVRNPWARLVSEYNYRRLLGDKHFQCSFKTFLFKRFPKPESDSHVLVKDYYRHVMPQWQFLYDEEGNQLVDFIGKFESLQQDFNAVCQQLNIGEICLPHKNKTLASGIKQRSKLKLRQLLSTIGFSRFDQHRHYSGYYDDESKAFVADLYQKDIEIFDYQFEDAVTS